MADGTAQRARDDAGNSEWRKDIVTRSPLMESLLTQARLVADSEASVLIQGESGTGEEQLANHFLHTLPDTAKKGVTGFRPRPWR